MLASKFTLLKIVFLITDLLWSLFQTIATVCMFLASKVEETPCRLDKIVVVAYETMHKSDPCAAGRIREKV